MNWEEFYKEGHSLQTFFEQLTIHSEFVSAIMSEKPKNILEIGIGRGTFIALFSLLGIECSGIDSDNSIVDKYKAFASSLGLKGNIKLGDAFNIPFNDNEFDISISQGFFEHFSDNEIHSLLDEQLRVAKKVFFSVPSKYYRERDFGNERLMSMNTWKSVLDKYIIGKAVPYYYKRLKKNLLLRLPLMYFFVIEGKKR
jgi:ubiquinone/menaquinone biosynthesis C-methylase UbiE